MKYTFQDVDERIIKTRFALTDAILNLIKKEDKIKVLNICHEANITPMTYYHHFNNKQQLFEFAIRMQLSGVLPIPRKLKPISLKHLIYYLTFSFGKFISNNQELFSSAIKQANEGKYFGSYIDLIDKIISKLIKEEIKSLIRNNNFVVEMFTNIICGSLKQVFMQIVRHEEPVNSKEIWESIKSLFINFQ